MCHNGGSTRKVDTPERVSLTALMIVKNEGGDEVAGVYHRFCHGLKSGVTLILECSSEFR